MRLMCAVTKKIDIYYSFRLFWCKLYATQITIANVLAQRETNKHTNKTWAIFKELQRTKESNGVTLKKKENKFICFNDSLKCGHAAPNAKTQTNKFVWCGKINLVYYVLVRLPPCDATANTLWQKEAYGGIKIHYQWIINKQIRWKLPDQRFMATQTHNPKYKMYDRRAKVNERERIKYREKNTE